VQFVTGSAFNTNPGYLQYDTLRTLELAITVCEMSETQPTTPGPSVAGPSYVPDREQRETENDESSADGKGLDSGLQYALPDYLQIDRKSLKT
jgi:hypothetical protein